jgi:hypothetical protein
MFEGNGLGGAWKENEERGGDWFRRYTPTMEGKAFLSIIRHAWAWTLVIKADGTTAGYNFTCDSIEQAKSECDGAAIATLLRWAQEGEPKEREIAGVLLLPDGNYVNEEWLRDIVAFSLRSGFRVMVCDVPEAKFLPFRLYVASAEEAAKYAGLTEGIMALAKDKLASADPKRHAAPDEIAKAAP